MIKKRTKTSREILIEQPIIRAVLCDIRSRENVGSIFRTADAGGIKGLYLCGITPKPPHEKISKTALGAEESVSWEYHSQAWRLIQKLKKEGYQIVALEQSPKSENIFSFSKRFWGQNEGKKKPVLGEKNLKIKNQKILPKRGVILVVGNEINGISKNILNQAGHVIHIPMQGTKESLNVAVAFGIAVYAIAGTK